VSEDPGLDRWEITRAIIGLRRAYKRAMDAYSDLLRNRETAGAAVAEFVSWACGLDERLSKDKKYAARRDSDKQGQVLLPLRFVRDRHTHQLAVTTALEVSLERSSDPDASPDLLKVMNRWRPLDLITEPTDGHEKDPYYPARRAAYEKHLEGRKPALAMRDALEFLNREVAVMGIEVHDPSEQV
jgi:hypothetical protein